MSEDVATDVSSQVVEQQPQIQKAERMVPQHEVDKAVYAVKMKAKEDLAALEAQYRQSNSAGSMGGMPTNQGFDKHAFLKEAKEMMKAELDEQRQTLEEQQHRAQLDGFVKEYIEKMKQGENLYEDFKEVTNSFNPGKYPQIAIMAGQMENTPDIIYELKKNPHKLTHLQVLAFNDDTDGLREEITKLSKSIKRNEQGVANNSKSPAPLSKIKSSAVAGSDTGKRSISDIRKNPLYRG